MGQSGNLSPRKRNGYCNNEHLHSLYKESENGLYANKEDIIV
jgi:hypothetical protein